MIKSKWLYPAGVLSLLVLATGSWASEGSVARAQFTTDIIDREPVDEIISVDTSVKTVFYFTELKDMAGKSVTHRWIFDGKKVYEKTFDIAGDRWRVYTSKNLSDAWTGDWRAEVVDSAGTVLQSNTLSYGETGTKSPANDTSAKMSEEDADADAEPAMKSDGQEMAGKEMAGTSGEMAMSEHVKRAVITTDVVDREPVDDLMNIDGQVQKVFFFTEIVDFAGNSVSHRWIFNDETKAEVGPWQIESSRYRTSSSKNMSPEWKGKWVVQVVDDADNVLAEKSFLYE